jgi:hypothetical protein
MSESGTFELTPVWLIIRTPCAALWKEDVHVKTIHVGADVAQTTRIAGDLDSK